MRNRSTAGFVEDLRRELTQLRSVRRPANTVHSGGFHMSDELLLSLVSGPTATACIHVEHVGHHDVPRIGWSAGPTPKVGIVSFRVGDHWCDPYVFDVDDPENVNVSILLADLEWGIPECVRGLSYVLNPDMSIHRWDGSGHLVYQTGTYDVLPTVAAIDGIDDVVIDFRSQKDDTVAFVDLVNHHRSSGMDVTWTLSKGPRGGNTIPVWRDGRVAVCDPRDLPDDIDPRQAGYHSTGLCVVSRGFVSRLVKAAPDPTTWRRRKVIQDGTVIVRFERHLHELTSLDDARVGYVCVP